MNKSKEFIFKDNIEKLKNNIFNEYSYNFDNIKKHDNYSYDKKYYFENKEYKENKVK